MLTQLLTTAAALLILGTGEARPDYISRATLINAKGQNGVSWGTLVVTVKGDGLYHRGVTGMVCDDYMTDDTAHFLCQAAGFGSMEQWSRLSRASDAHKLPYAEWQNLFVGKFAGFALDDLQCGPGATRLEECSHNSAGHHNCDYSEGMVLKCSEMERGVDLEDMDVQLQKGRGVMSSNGTVLLNGTRSSGLVCADGVTSETAELLCNEAGYDTLVDYQAAKNVNRSSKLSCDTLRYRNISVIVEDLDCPSNSTELGDCSASHARGDCDADDALWLSCTNDSGQEWELIDLTLAYNVAGHHEKWDLETDGDFGTVLVTVRNTKTGEERTGLTSYTSSSYTAYSMCHMMGYPNGQPHEKRTGDVRDTFNIKVSCGYILENDMDFVLSYLWCPAYYQELSSCRFYVAPDGYNPGLDNAMWLNCS